jgi:SAM-dependent methyltransferase
MPSAPASRFVHPKARFADAEHDYSLDIASDSTPNYLRWIADLCQPHLGRSVLDLGAGHGTVTQHLTAGRQVVALDRSDACIAAMETRFRDVANVRVVKGDIEELEIGEPFDSIVMINVLEHVFDDSGVLASLRPYLRPGGRVILYVPAHNLLYTAWDRKVGHFRRYSRQVLDDVIREAGLVPVSIRYVNLLSMMAWPFSGKILASDQAVRQSLSLWDQVGTRLGRALESRVRVPTGLNLFCVARFDDPT